MGLAGQYAECKDLFGTIIKEKFGSIRATFGSRAKMIRQSASGSFELIPSTQGALVYDRLLF